jgi:hypothetical protein
MVTRLRRFTGSVVLAALVGALLAVPVALQALRGGAWLGAQLTGLGSMVEAESVTARVGSSGWAVVTRQYSGLIWLLPLSCIAAIWHWWRERTAPALFLAVSALFGSALLLAQYRLNYFGSWVSYLPLCLVFDTLRSRWSTRGPLTVGAAALLWVAALAPAVAELRRPLPAGGDFDYALTQSIYPTLASACDARPGIVLADHNDGHYISYHSRCAVMADNFILTPQHEEKIREVNALLRLPLVEVLRRAPSQLRYIYVRRDDNIYASDCGRRTCLENAGLRQELLFGPPPDPTLLRLIGEINFKRSPSGTEPLARLYEVQP